MVNRLYYRSFVGLSCLTCATFLATCTPAIAFAQQTPIAVDEIGKQAAALETELGKYKDTSPDAADALVKLVDLYYEDGRLFGLVQAGQKFASAHPRDPRQKAVLLKLIEGQAALSRDQEVAATIRQFIARFPDAAENAALEVRLADALRQLPDRAKAAEACRDVYRRHGNDEIGRRYGVLAIERYNQLNQQDGYLAEAVLAEEMLEKLPAGDFASDIGWQAFSSYRRIGQWAKSSAVGTKILQKGLGGDPESLRQLHREMAENSTYLGQHANAAESYAQARKIRDDAHLHLQELIRRYSAGAKPAELEPLMREYGKKYPDRPDRLHGVSYVALSCLSHSDKARGLQLLALILADDPTTNDNAAVFVREVGADPAKLADAEQKLREAIGMNKRGVYYLRYVLAIDVYRDRMKDIPKAKAVCRELIQQSPDDQWQTRTAAEWLLSASSDDAEFNRDLAMILEARKRHPHNTQLRTIVRNWAQQARGNKELATRVAAANQALQPSDAEPVIKAFIDQRDNRHAGGESIRAQWLEPGKLDSLHEDAARYLLQTQAEWFRHYAQGDRRGESAKVYRQFAAKFPQDRQVAQWWLESATDHGQPEDAKAAAEHWLKFPPDVAQADQWRRLLIAADRNNDANLARNVWNWMQQAQQKFGTDAQYAGGIGDMLLKLGLEKEAEAHWKTYVSVNRKNYESRECASRLLSRLTEPAARIALISELLKQDSSFYGRYAQWAGDEHIKAGDWNNAKRVVEEARTRKLARPLRWGDFDVNAISSWIDQIENRKELDPTTRKGMLEAIRDLDLHPAATLASFALNKESTPAAEAKTKRLLELAQATIDVGNEWYDWDRLMPIAQGSLGRREYMSSVVLATGMLAHITNVDDNRKKAARDLVTQSLSQMGGVGLTIDDSSPVAPLLQAAMYLRLGDTSLAFETYEANRELFRENRNELPPDLLMFVCDRLLASGTDADHDYVEEILRGWLVKYSENEMIDQTTKARMQLLLAKNFFRAQRFDVARAEYNTVINRYAGTAQAIEAEFGIGETFLAQKVYDQAETVFEKLSRSVDADVIVRAEFLRGVLAFRRGDRDEAREIFQSVLERVPNVELANQTLFNLAEVYGAEERYIDQLNLLRTVGRLGRASKRRHIPGTPLSIVVHDSDLGISRGHNRIPVRVSTVPGGDSETIYLVSSGAGKGLFRADLETQLGTASPNDQMLQIMGSDIIKCDYPDEFKAEFKNVPLSDVEISIAADAKFEVASSQIIDETQETISEELTRQAAEERGERRVSQVRPANQIKPGNPIYLRVKDGDRDRSHEPDEVVVKLVADSGDQIQVTLSETGPHTGIFLGTANTGDLPAGALASDTGIEHSPLMAIDRDPESYWLSEPDGATPKWLSVDMKDLHEVSRVRLSSLSEKKHSPVRGEVYGSQDGELWFRLAGHPGLVQATALPTGYEAMTRRVYAGDHTSFSNWDQVVSLAKNTKPFDEGLAETLMWSRPEGDESSNAAYTVIWQGKLNQPKAGAVRLAVKGVKMALVLNGRLELPLGAGGRSVDVWLDAGTHDLAIFAASNKGEQPVEALIARASLVSSRVTLNPFRPVDFDLTSVNNAPGGTTNNTEPQDERVSIALTPANAQLKKKTEQFGVNPANNTGAIGYWQSPEDQASWEVDIPATGPYEVFLELSHAGDGGRYEVVLGEKELEGLVSNTGSWSNFVKQRVGTLLIDKPGKHLLTINPIEIVGEGLMDLKSVTIEPAKGQCVVQEGTDWEFRFPARDLRYVKFVCHEYLGEALALRNLEVSGADSSKAYIPTEEDVLALAQNDVLEIAGGDNVTATYTDEVTLNEMVGSQLLSGKLQATYYNAKVGAIAYDFMRSGGSAVYTNRKELKRIDAGERIIVEITDYDEDRTDQPDTIRFQVQVNEDAVTEWEATETSANSGMFTKEIDTVSAAESLPAGKAADTTSTNAIAVKPGDKVVLRYMDTHNTFPGHTVPREEVVFVPVPTAAMVRVLETRVVPSPQGEPNSPQAKQPPRVMVLPRNSSVDTSAVAFEAPLTVEVIDPDAAKDSRSTALVKLTTTDGATVEVNCRISSLHMEYAGEDAERTALEQGRFVGQVMMRLGGKTSPAVVPLTDDMPRNLVGEVLLGEEQPTEEAAVVAGFEQEAAPGASATRLATRVLNLTGRDIVTASYRDERKPTDAPESVEGKGRLVSNGQLFVTDRDYEKPVTQVHVGERLYLKVIDPDADHSDARDSTSIVMTSSLGEKETIQLEETLSHSGEFTGSMQLKAVEKPTPGNLTSANPEIETFFGDLLTITFKDPAASTESGTLEQAIEIPVVVGTDGIVIAFSKTFQDETLAVETRFRIAESYFELFKSHKQLERDAEKLNDLESGRRVLREVMDDYPDPKYAPRVAYLLGQFSQELEEWDEAIKAYETILRQYPEDTLAPDAQYKLAQCYEQAGNFDQALEAYVTLAATHPKSPLIPNVMIRISDYFYKNENFEVAAQVGEKFLERFETHANAPRMAFRIGQCYHKAEKYPDAGKSFERFVDLFPKDELAADAFFWAGESYRMANNNRQAFISYNNCRWKHPESEAAKYARGRLALPEMLQQFEAEANSVDEDN